MGRWAGSCVLTLQTAAVSGAVLQSTDLVAGMNTPRGVWDLIRLVPGCMFAANRKLGGPA